MMVSGHDLDSTGCMCLAKGTWVQTIYSGRHSQYPRASSHPEFQ